MNNKFVIALTLIASQICHASEERLKEFLEANPKNLAIMEQFVEKFTHYLENFEHMSDEQLGHDSIELFKNFTVFVDMVIKPICEAENNPGNPSKLCSNLANMQPHIDQFSAKITAREQTLHAQHHDHHGKCSHNIKR